MKTRKSTVNILKNERNCIPIYRNGLEAAKRFWESREVIIRGFFDGSRVDSTEQAAVSDEFRMGLEQQHAGQMREK